ncbi:MAG: sensor domain-containing diguanylate cyclase [Aliidiomarina sp.]|uniref:sensor domain-containing diguanylate cyclase n=1 Tax=Aliidiomarina sp. TaxID=1872439 RepID=UPI0025C3496A|nr:sensor domain-containing diguanylate cyclase [Aliidiomarina sp.]MCH8500708.1 sensor domain-containing diguanylate cyclase [Aliidiomarina sp.]
MRDETASVKSYDVSDEKRLEALYRYNILDTDFDPCFDDLAELGAYICEMPIAVINFVDKDRQWFKSEIGLGVRETALDVSVCKHAILQPGLFVVPDMTKDERFANYDLVTGEPHLRFYAGALLESSDGFPLGTFCVLDYQPRELTAQQQKALKTLARQVMNQLELMKINAEQRETLKDLERSHKLLEIEASTDELTQLANRRAITHALQHELSLMQSMRRPSSALLLDLDFFKAVNDQHGHLVGDEVLKEFAAFCNHEFRSSDLIGRWGGEEFVFILPGSDIAVAQKVVTRFQEKLKTKSFTKARIQLSFSAGLIELNTSTSPKSTFKKLDDLLYQAKTEGRDQIICAAN